MSMRLLNMLRNLLRTKKSLVIIILILVLVLGGIMWILRDKSPDAEMDVDKQEEPYDGDGLSILDEDTDSEHQSIDVPALWDEESSTESEDKDVNQDDGNSGKEDVTNEADKNATTGDEQDADKTTDGDETEDDNTENNGELNDELPDDDKTNWGTIF